MKYSWIDTELLQKPSVTKDLQAEWNWIRYHIGGKMFAAVCLDDATGKPVYITCKLGPAEETANHHRPCDEFCGGAGQGRPQ